MNEVFMHAAFGRWMIFCTIPFFSNFALLLAAIGDKNHPARPSPYSNFDKAELEDKSVRNISLFESSLVHLGLTYGAIVGITQGGDRNPESRICRTES
jgi:hypothetical protein